MKLLLEPEKKILWKECVSPETCFEVTWNDFVFSSTLIGHSPVWKQTIVVYFG